MRIELPLFVKAFLKRLNDAGYKSYAVGGFVRDSLLSRDVFDVDVATSALPEQVKVVFSDCKTIDVGIAHGTVTVLFEDEKIEATSFRAEGGYTDSRHPDNVTFIPSLKGDLTRRDFTVNALCCDVTGEIIDHTGGLCDLSSRTLRAIGNADERFQEDALRILRGIRFMAQLDFTIEQKTLTAMTQASELLKSISTERIYSEVIKTLDTEKPSAALKLMLENKILSWLFVADTHIFSAIDAADDTIVRLALLLSKNVDAMESLRLSTKLYQQIKFILSRPDCKSRIAIKTVLSRGYSRFSVARRLKYDLALGNEWAKRSLCLLKEIIDNNECYLLNMLKINGNDLKEMGFSGKDCGDMLKRLLTFVINEELTNDYTALYHHAAIEYAKTRE